MAGRKAPINTDALLQQAQMAFSGGDHRGALALFKKAGANAEALIGAANAHLALSETSAARQAAQKALRLRPESAEILCLMARVELLGGARESALSVIDRALAASPGLSYAMQIKAEILRLDGRKQEAHALLKGLVDRGETHPGVMIGYAELAAEEEGADACVEIAERLLALPGLRPAQRSMLLLRIGSALDKAGDYDRAFAYASRGNRILAADWDIAASNAMLDDRFEACTAETLGAMPRSNVRSTTPLFVMGLPRSGTSLTEQILACHSRVFGAGELGEVPRIVGELLQASGENAAMDARMREMPKHMLDARARAHLKRLLALGGGAAHVVDKRPHNFLFLPEIASLFPGARVALCRRHPLDNCLSCFLTNLGPHHAWSSDLVALGHYYARADKLMRRYAEMVDLPILTVEYQDMVEDHEATVRRLVEHMGLAWEDDCLRHDQSSRVVMTASAEQATKPIYTSSLARWKRYEKHLGPLVETLQELGVEVPDA